MTVGPVTTRLLQAGPNQASEAVVFIHGNPGSAGDFAELVQEVGEHRRAIAFDLPDFGQTVGAPDFGHTVVEYAEFVGELLNTLGISHVHLVLHDFGGPIGLTWAADHLGANTSITLINTGLLLDYKWHRTARAWQTRGVGELLQAITTRSMFRRVAGNTEPRGLPRAFLDEMYDNYDRRTRAAVLDLYRDSKKIRDDHAKLVPLFAAADIPALVIWGAGDRYLGVEMAERQKEGFPSAEVHILPDSGHWPYIDDPPAVSRLLLDFLDLQA
ncbi:MAG: alpha/beta hydrolase [Solirubrobacterales bacterium]|nr:alpha/beta hydrolase [Solirubrobacterales bacterium]